MLVLQVLQAPGEMYTHSAVLSMLRVARTGTVSKFLLLVRDDFLLYGWEARPMPRLWHKLEAIWMMD